MTIGRRTKEFKFHKKQIKGTLSKDATCPYCNVIMEREDTSHPSFATIDHIVPFSVSKDHKGKNLIAVCRSCNCSKGSLTKFETYSLLKPTRLSPDQVRAMGDLVYYERQMSIMEEIRVLVMIGEYESIKAYPGNYVKRLGQSAIYKDIRSILKIRFEQLDKGTYSSYLNRVGITNRKTPKDQLNLALVEHRIAYLEPFLTEARLRTRGIDYKIKEIDIVEVLQNSFI